MGPPPFVQGVENHYTPRDFTVDSVSTAVRRIVEQPSYRNAALRIQRLGSTMRGADLGAREVELAALHGVQHLIAPERYRRRSGSNIWAAAFGIVWTSVGLGMLLFMTRK